MADFRIEPRGEGRYILTGVMTFETVPEIAQQGFEALAGADTVSLDISGISRIDSAGVAQLIEWVRAAGRYRRQVVFTNIPPQVVSLVKVSGLEEILSIAVAPAPANAATEPAR